MYEIDIQSQRNDDKTIDFNYVKTGHGNYSVVLKFSALSNANFLSRTFIADRLSGKLMTLKPIDNQRHISMSGYAFSYARGILNPKIDHDFIYILPFKKGTDVSVVTSDVYHFLPNLADTVFASRKGTVIDKARDGDINREYQTFSKNKNGILVEHNDGTLAAYEGFLGDGIFVEIGDKIYPQTPIGLLPKQGHLLFYVRYLSDANFEFRKALTTYKYINPIFRTNSGNLKLETGKGYMVDFDKGLVTKEMSKKEIKKMSY